MGRRIVLIGAGSAQFGFDMLGDIFRSQLLAGSAVVLHNIDATALRHVESAAAAVVREYGPAAASLILSAAPIIVLYLVLQKYIIKGIASGAVKG